MTSNCQILRHVRGAVWVSFQCLCTSCSPPLLLQREPVALLRLCVKRPTSSISSAGIVGLSQTFSCSLIFPYLFQCLWCFSVLQAILLHVWVMLQTCRIDTTHRSITEKVLMFTGFSFIDMFMLLGCRENTVAFSFVLKYIWELKCIYIMLFQFCWQLKAYYLTSHFHPSVYYDLWHNSLIYQWIFCDMIWPKCHKDTLEKTLFKYIYPNITISFMGLDWASLGPFLPFWRWTFFFLFNLCYLIWR